MTYFATNQEKIKPLIGSRSILAAMLVFIVILLPYSPWVLSLEKRTGLMWLFRLRGEVSPPTDIVIVAINSAAAERMGYSRHSFTWPRTVYASLLKQLQLTTADMVIMDIAFRSPRTEQEDAAFEEALAQSGNVILYKYLKRRQINSPGGIIDIEEQIPPLQRFAQHALASGFFILPKTTGLIFETPIYHHFPGGPEASQPLLAYLAGQPIDKQNRLWQALTGEAIDTSSSLEEKAKMILKLADQVKPSDIPRQSVDVYSVFANEQALLINFYGASQTINHIDIDQVLNMNQKSLKQWFDGKTVYIGYLESWQTEQQDAYSTIFTSSKGVDISGVEISATVLSNLRHQQYIQPVSRLWQSAILAATLLFGLLAYRCSITINVMVQSAGLAVYVTLASMLFGKYYLLLPLGSPLLVLFTLNSLQLLYHYRVNRTRLQHIRYALSQYLPQQAAHSLSQNINALEKQYQVVSGVVLITDIKGYTSLSETLAPEVLHSLMNRYYQGLVATVKKHDGFIGNIVGDSLMALWTGASLEPAMCRTALACAQEIQRVIDNDVEIARRLPTCIALHGGQFSLGNLGAEGHFEYSPVGDIINTASRIEHFNRDLGTRLLLSQSVASHLIDADRNSGQQRYLGDFNLRNKAAAVPLYTDSLAEGKARELFSQAVGLYQQHQFVDAQRLFSQLSHEYQDGPCRYYDKACQKQIELQ